MDAILNFASDPIIMVILGVLINYVRELVSIRQDGESANFLDYYKKHPYVSGLTVLSAVAGYLALDGMGQLTPEYALAVGFASENFINMMMKKRGVV